MDFYDKAPRRVPSTIADVLIAALIVICAGVLYLIVGGCSAKSDEEIAAESERAAHDKKITYRLPDGRIFQATLPIDYAAKVSQCTVKDGCKTRYYYPRQR